MNSSRFVRLLSLLATAMAAASSVHSQAPAISAISPLQAPPGGTVVIEGGGLAGAEEVVFTDKTSGENRPATFVALSDSQLRVTVPAGTPGRQAMLTVRGAEGAVVTFSEDIPERPAGETLATSATGASIITHGTIWIGTTSSSIFLKPGASGEQNSNRHYNTFYVDEEAALVGLGGSNNWVYHTPNAVIGWSSPGANHRVIPVATLSIARVPSLFEWVEAASAFTLTTEVEGAGSVLVEPEKDSYLENETVSITAVPDEGSGLVRWSGDLEGDNRPPLLRMDRQRTIRAHFAEKVGFGLSVEGGGRVLTYPEATAYGRGAELELSPAPNLGWRFDGWSGDASGSANPLLLTLDSPRAITARFSPGVVQWGRMNNEPSIPAPSLKAIVSVAAGGYHNLALRADGTIASWTTPSSASFAPVPPASLSNIVAIAAGSEHGLALRKNGTVVGWGTLGAAPSDLGSVIAIAAGSHHALALRQDGTVAAWGSNDAGQANVPADLEDVVAVSAGYHHSLALLSDGTVRGWGESFYLPPPGLADVVAVSAGTSHSLALKRDGSIVGWGRTENGRSTHPAGLTDVVGIAAGSKHSLALRADGTVHQWGDTSWVVETVPAGLAGVGEISAATSSNVALLRPEMPPHVTVMPQVARAPVGGKVILRAHAHGMGSLSYQWRKGGEDIAGAIEPFLVLENLAVEDLGEYSIVVSNVYGWVESEAASVVDPDLVTITADVVNGEVVVDPAAPHYAKGSSVTITAIPDEGYRFVGWTGSVFSMENPLIVTLQSDLQLNAVFEPIDRMLPEVDYLLPPQAPAGATVRLYGRNFSDVTSVRLVPDYRASPYLGENLLEEPVFEIVSDEIMDVVIPADTLLEDVPVPVVLFSPSGVTVVTGPRERELPPTWRIVVLEGPDAVLPFDRVSRSLVYLRSGASFPGSFEGTNNMIFLEPGASFTGELPSGNTVFISDGAQFVPSSAEDNSYDPRYRVPSVALNLLDAPLVIGPVPPIYSVSADVQGNGTVEVWPPRPDNLYEGETVRITATPAEGETFFGWSGSYTTNLNPLEFVIDGDTSLTARFAIARTLTTDVIGGGSVQRSPTGAVYPDGELVALTAVAESGWSFVGWDGALTGHANPQTVSMTEDRAVTARFMRPQTITLDNVADRHHGSAPFSVTALATSGLPVILEVVSGPAALEGDQLALTGVGTVVLRATQPGNETWLPATAVELSFISGYALLTEAANGGTIARQPSRAIYAAGETVGVSALPATGYRFTGWGGDFDGVETPLQVTMSGDRTIAAGFVRVWNLTVQSTAGGSVGVDPQQSEFDHEEIATLTATAADGFEFTGWSGSASGSENPLVLSIDSNKTITADFRDAVAPAVAIATPVTGTTRDERFALAGTITDNVGVASAAWSWNGVDKGSLALGEGGAFEVEDLSLHQGENNIVVTALDAAGNEGSATVATVWRPGIHLFAVSPPEVQEGLRVDVPIRIDSEGEVAGMTFTLRYDPDFLGDPLIEWSEHLNQAFRQTNTATAGEVFITFSLPGSTIPDGDQLIANLSFRARSVPESLVTPLALEVHDASDPVGNAFPYGVVAEGGEAEIRIRNYPGDNNGNDRLDIGDATIVQRLIAGLLERRAWDVAGNDLNQNTFLDSGDVTRILRAVAGIDPQPSSPAPTVLIAGDDEDAGGAVAMAAISPTTAGAERLVFPDVTYEINEVAGTVTVQVLLADTATPVSGLAFALDYDPAALRLRNNQSHRIGAMIPGGTMALWNVEPAQIDYSRQSGRLRFAATRETAWAQRSGTVAEVTFDVQPGVLLRSAWPLRLSHIEVTGDGFDVRTLEPAETAIAVQRPAAIAFQDWIDQQEQIDPDRRGATEDGHGHGLSNLLTYALGKAEGAPERDRLPAMDRLVDGEDEYLVMTLRIPPHVRGIQYLLEASSDLAAWESLPLRPQVLGSEPDGSTRISLRDSVPMREIPTRFLRLRVEEESHEPGPGQ